MPSSSARMRESQDISSGPPSASSHRSDSSDLIRIDSKATPQQKRRDSRPRSSISEPSVKKQIPKTACNKCGEKIIEKDRNTVPKVPNVPEDSPSPSRSTEPNTTVIPSPPALSPKATINQASGAICLFSVNPESTEHKQKQSIETGEGETPETPVSKEPPEGVASDDGSTAGSTSPTNTPTRTGSDTRAGSEFTLMRTGSATCTSTSTCTRTGTSISLMRTASATRMNTCTCTATCTRIGTDNTPTRTPNTTPRTGSAKRVSSTTRTASTGSLRRTGSTTRAGSTSSYTRTGSATRAGSATGMGTPKTPSFIGMSTTPTGTSMSTTPTVSTTLAEIASDEDLVTWSEFGVTSAPSSTRRRAKKISGAEITASLKAEVDFTVVHNLQKFTERQTRLRMHYRTKPFDQLRPLRQEEEERGLRATLDRILANVPPPNIHPTSKTTASQLMKNLK